MTKQSRDGAQSDFRKMQLRILLMYITVIVVMAVVLSTVLLSLSSSMLSDKVSALIAANSRQVEMNINNYLSNVEATSTLLFADRDYYEYDPVTTRLGEYACIKLEEAIASRIVDLALMDSFADFTIVYSTGDRVGLTSDTTSTLFEPAELYTVLEAHIDDDYRENAWIFGLGGVMDRLYYVKRLNPNALLTASFYTRELSTVFEYPMELNGMKICLVNDEDQVLYSSEPDFIGKALDPVIVKAIEDGSEAEECGYFVNVNACENGWRVVCYISRSLIFKDTRQTMNIAILLSTFLAVAFSTVGMYLITGFFKPVDAKVSTLEENAVKDRLSGLLNKLAFQDAVSKQLGGVKFGNPQVFIMIDMDNFKNINDTKGHAYGDEVIQRMGHILNDNFGETYTIGRLGGDEFAMYLGVECSRESALEECLLDMKKLFFAFDKEFAAEMRELSISLSVGVTVQDDERRFKNLYANADMALYTSKNSGKNKYTIYKPQSEPEKEDETGGDT